MHRLCSTLVALLLPLLSSWAAAEPPPAKAPGGAKACPAGMRPVAAYGGRCCWPGQSWKDDRCQGAPQCPKGTTVRGNSCGRPGTYGVEWVGLPGGDFIMGSAEGDEDERPAHTRNIPAFEMMRTEVTVAMYRKCVRADRCGADLLGKALLGGESRKKWSRYCNWARSGHGAHPLNCVDWSQAKAFCAAVGGRLPSEAQWEFAARGPVGRRFAFGNALMPGVKSVNLADTSLLRKFSTWTAERTYTDGFVATAPVGSFPKGATPEGILDLTGNVWEWTADAYDSKAYTKPGAPLLASPGGERVMRGGSWVGPLDQQRASDRVAHTPETRDNGVGFRCVR